MRRPVLWALVPVLAFVAAALVADPWSDHSHVERRALPSAMPLLLCFVWVPCVLHLLATSRRWLRWVLLAVITITAATAGASVVATDDAQAGLAILLVAYVAVPLAVLVGGAEHVVGLATHRRRRRAREPPGR